MTFPTFSFSARFSRGVVVFALRLALLSAALACSLQMARADALADGLQQLRSGAYEEAITSARTAREDDAGIEESWRLEADALLVLGRYEEAYTLLKDAREMVPFSIRLRLLGREAALRTNRDAEAVELVQEMAYVANNTPRYARSRDFLAAMGEAALLMGVEPRLVLENFLKPAQNDPVSPSRDAFIAAGKLALDKDDYAVASRTFQQGLTHFPDDPDMWWGMAASFINGDRTKLIEYANQGLARNPNNLPIRLLLAEHRIDTEDYEAAAAEIASIRKINSHHAEALALEAVVAHLQHRLGSYEELRLAALSTWRNNPQVDHLIGRKLSQKYRFVEGAEAQRRALAMDPKFSPARIQLAQDLLRLAKHDEGWQHARQAHEQDPYDVTAYNLTVLQDQLEDFTLLSSPYFRLRMSKKEAAIYGDRALALLENARQQLEAKYGVTLDQPTTVEIYPDPKDFAVRTFGMPGRPGYLGVCFGPVFTVNSPATQRANWEAVLWHEFCHVITLTMTRNRMPRWLSEGISVYEERQANPNWGERMTPGYQQRILQGRMQKVSEMSAAFLQAESSEDVMFAYFQSSLVVQFIVENYGFDSIKALLASLREGVTMNDALARHVAPLEKLEAEFVPFAQGEARKLGGGYQLVTPGEGMEAIAARMNPRNLPTQLEEARDLMKQEKWADAKTKLTELTRATGYVPGENNAHALLAQVCAQLNDREGEAAAWAIIAENESDALEAVSRLTTLARETEDWTALERWSDAWLAINPLATTPWRFLLEAAEKRSAAERAISAGRTLLQLEPTDVAAIHYRVARQLEAANPDEARKHVLLALAEAPRYRAAHEMLARIETPAANAATAAE